MARSSKTQDGGTAALLARGRRLRFEHLLLAAQLAMRGKEHWDRLTAREQLQLRAMLTKSKGLPQRLTPSERREVLRLLRKLELPQLARRIAALGAPLAKLRNRRR